MGWVNVGLQDANDRICKEVYKRPIGWEVFRRAADLIHEYPVAPYYDLILNNPFATFEEDVKTAEMLLDLPRPYFLQPFSLTFYRGTEIRERALRERPECVVEPEFKDCYRVEFVPKEAVKVICTTIHRPLGRALIRRLRRVPDGWLTQFLMDLAGFYHRMVLQPFTILLSLPLAIGGVAAALILTGSALSMPVLIGILMLMGIVTKNAILLVDFAVEMRARGMDRVSAVIEAGHKRAQPIVMTSIAMSAGMLPSALGVGEGGAFRAPMATAVIGGIIVSTVLSLVVVPSFYLIMDDLSRGLGKVFSRMVGKKEVEPVEPAAHELAASIEGLEQSQIAAMGLISADQADLRSRLSVLEARAARRSKPDLAAE